MWKGDEVLISKQNNLVQIKTNHLKFRKGETFKEEYVVAYHDNPLRAYLMKYGINKNNISYRIVYTFDKTGSDKFTTRSIKNFVNERSDLYIINTGIYDHTYKLIGYTIPSISEYLCLSNNIYIKDVFNDAFTFHVYLCTLENGSIMLFERVPRVIFVSEKRKKILEKMLDLLPARDNIQIFDDLIFKNFKVTEELVQKLRKLESIQEMGAILKKEMLLTTL